MTEIHMHPNAAQVAEEIAKTLPLDATLRSEPGDFCPHGVGLYVIRKGKNFLSQVDGDWGVFAGRQTIDGESKLVVVLRQCGAEPVPVHQTKVLGYVLYDNCGELQREWQLD